MDLPRRQGWSDPLMGTRRELVTPHMFGSALTGLAIPSSDLDLVVLGVTPNMPSVAAADRARGDARRALQASSKPPSPLSSSAPLSPSLSRALYSTPFLL